MISLLNSTMWELAQVSSTSFLSLFQVLGSGEAHEMEHFVSLAE